jgi:hypothetical protein
MSFYDVVCNGPHSVPPSFGEKQLSLVAPFKDRLAESVVVKTDNVTEYLAPLIDPRWQLSREIPCLAPIAPVVFMETNRPSGDSPMAVFYRSLLSRWGAIFITVEISDRRHAEAAFGPALFIDGDPRWVSYVLIFGQMLFSSSPSPLGVMSVAIDGDGGLMRFTDGREALVVSTFITPKDVEVLGDIDTDPNEFLECFVVAATWPFWMATSFMHCKNVRMVDNEGRHPSRQARREAERKNLPRPSRFYTLEIEPMKKVLATEGGIQHNGLKKALHICRGHFSTYSEDKPLFGKYAGRFWIPAHVRGSSDVGIVGKDYRVNAPKEDAA